VCDQSKCRLQEALEYCDSVIACNARSGLYCNLSAKKCTARINKENEACVKAHIPYFSADSCLPGLVCSEQTGKCRKERTEGSACSTSTDCDTFAYSVTPLTCVEGKCRQVWLNKGSACNITVRVFLLPLFLLTNTDLLTLHRCFQSQGTFCKDSLCNLGRCITEMSLPEGSPC
jgi:hypothetical protein